MKITKINHHGNVRWRVNFQLGGKPVKRLFAREGDAKAFAGQYQDAAGMLRQLAGLPQAVVADTLAAVQIAEAGQFKLMDAAMAYDQYRPRTDVLTADAIREFLVYWEGLELAKSSSKTVKNIVKGFGALYGDMPLGEITHKTIEEFAKVRGRAPITQKGYRTRLSRFFNWSVKQGWIAKNPAADAELSPIGQKEICWHNAEQAGELLATAKKHHPAMVPFLAIGYFCGLRISEMVGSADSIGVGWPNIHLDRPTPELEVPTGAGRTRMRRMVPVPPNCVKWLKRGGDLYPFTNYRKKMEKLRNDAKLGALGQWEWGSHIKRHTFASMHVAQHGRPDWTKYLMGHEEKSDVFRRHYDGRVSPAEARAFWEIAP
ncbi:MAG: phage integrase SAM-like domain-containing protein [Verrucomicrobia subdivision 3 bacterium]|nr:phage integrase SAM-like domain-containing protein [Limisphaerales bacterium]